MKKKIFKEESGYTLIELIVSIFLGLFVATMIFAGYTGLFKGFRIQAKRAEIVREMITARRAVGRALDSMETVAMVSPMKIRFTKKGSNADHTVEFQNNSVIADGNVLVKNVEKILIEETKGKQGSNGRLIRWECELIKGGWAGGTCRVCR